MRWQLFGRAAAMAFAVWLATYALVVAWGKTQGKGARDELASAITTDRMRGYAKRHKVAVAIAAAHVFSSWLMPWLVVGTVVLWVLGV